MSSTSLLPGRHDLSWYKGNGPHIVSITTEGTALELLEASFRIIDMRTGALIEEIAGDVLSVSSVEFELPADLDVEVGDYAYDIPCVFDTGESYTPVNGVFSVNGPISAASGCSTTDPGDVSITVAFEVVDITVSFVAPTLDFPTYTDDAAAAAGDPPVPVGGLYFVGTGSDILPAGTLKKRTV